MEVAAVHRQDHVIAFVVVVVIIIIVIIIVAIVSDVVERTGLVAPGRDAAAAELPYRRPPCPGGVDAPRPALSRSSDRPACDISHVSNHDNDKNVV